MITPDGWFDWAIRDPGPADKVYSEPCRSEGVIFHSAVGYYGGWRSRLDSTARLPNGRYTEYAAASVTGWIAYDGTLTQHYDIFKGCWASGSREANVRFNAFEGEGGWNPVNEPYRPAQIVTAVRISRDLMGYKHLERLHRLSLGVPPIGVFSLGEHNECVTLWGGGLTACPSHRVLWDAITKMLKEGDMTPEQMAELKDHINRALAASETRVNEKLQQLLTFDAAVAQNLDGDHEKIKAKLGIAP